MSSGSKIFLPNRCLGYVSTEIPLQVRYITKLKQNLIVTCVGKSFHTYGLSHFGLLSVSGLHPSDITCMTADAYHVYTACDTTIYAWRRGTELKHTYCAHKETVHLMLPFGPHLIAVDQRSNVKIWDIKDESMFLELSFTNKTFKITAIVHPNTYINKILFGSEQGSMQLWNIRTAKVIHTFSGWGSPISCLEQAPVVHVIAVGLHSGRIILHNIYVDQTIMEFTQECRVTCISFRTDDHPIMATGNESGRVMFWNLENRRIASQLSAHDKSVTGMVCLPGEPLVITSSPDNTLKLWIFDKTDGGARLLRHREGHSAAPLQIRFHGANGHNILSAAEDSSLRIFNTQTEQFNKSLGKASYNRKVSKRRGPSEYDPLQMNCIVQFVSGTTRDKDFDNIAALHEDKAVVTTWSYDKVKMGDLKLLPERLQGKKPSAAGVSATCLFLTHCGNFVIVGYSDGFVDRFNMQSGLWRGSYGNPRAHEGPVRGVSTDDLNQIAITGGHDSQMKFWKFKSKGSAPMTILTTTEPIRFFRAHHESSMLGVALEDFTIIVVDIDSRSIVRKFEGHTAQLNDATFSPDSRWLITASMDCAIRVWDIPSGALVDQFQTDSACVSLSMSANGETLATAHTEYLGIFLWCNRTVYSKITLKALSVTDEPPTIVLPEILNEDEEPIVTEDTAEPDFISPEQISPELITLSGLPSSRWLNLLDIDIIKKRNKPKEPPKAPKAAPFFLPTLPSLTFQFDLEKGSSTTPASKILIPENLLNLSAFGKQLDTSTATNDFTSVINALKGMESTLIEFEIKSLNPEAGGSVAVMLQFMKCIVFMLESNQNFDLAGAYLAVFLKYHGKMIASEESLGNYLPTVQNAHSASWNKIQKILLYSSCVAKLKTM